MYVKLTYKKDLDKISRNSKDLVRRTGSYKTMINKMFHVIGDASLEHWQSFLKWVFHKPIEMNFNSKKTFSVLIYNIWINDLVNIGCRVALTGVLGFHYALLMSKADLLGRFYWKM